MNTEQIKDTIRTIGKMTYAETVNNAQRIQAQASWEIALQLSLIAGEIRQANADNQK